MDLPLPHQWMLLALEDEHGTPQVADSFHRVYGLAGAFAAELQLRGRLLPVTAGNFQISEQGERPPGALGFAEEKLVARKPRGLNWLIGRVGQWHNQTRVQVLQELAELGAVRKEQDRWWIVTWRTRWPTVDPTIEHTVIEHLRAWMDQVSPEMPPGREDLLIGLLRATKNLGAVWTEEEVERWRPRIEERTRIAPIGRVVHEVTEATRAAIVAATAAGT